MLEVGESARLVTLYLVVRVRMVHVILLTRLLILSMRLLTLDPSPICGESAESNSVAFDDFIDVKLTQAFGTSILWSDGGLIIPGALGGFVHAVCQADK